MIRKPYSFLNATPRERRRPLFPVPEDIFASDDQVAERHEQEVRSPAIDRAIDDWNAAKELGDGQALRQAAKALVDATSAAFKLQGVPTFAHPVLPPQFVKEEVGAIANVPHDEKHAVLAGLLDKFDVSAKPGGLQQFGTQLSYVGGNATESLRSNRTTDELRPVPRSTSEGLLQTLDEDPAPREGLQWQYQTLEFQPEETPEVEKVVFVDENGKPVPSANPLSNGAIPPPRPSHNKMLPIQSAVPTKGNPKGYSSGEYDPNAIGLRVGKDNHGRLYWKRHDGIDFYARYGEPARVAADGVVVAVEHGVGGYGSLVAVRHSDGTMTMYAHLDPRSIRVRPGDLLRLGSVLGGAGTSGNAARPQVHFEVWRQPYLLPGGGLDYRQGHRNLLDPYEWYDRPMPGAVPRPKPTYR